MDPRTSASPTGRRRSVRAASLAWVMMVLVGGPALAGCTAAHDPATPTSTVHALPTMSGHVPDANATPATGPAAEDPEAIAAREAWSARPAYVTTNAATEEAYAYALANAGVIEWMPCYCGCGGMGHRSNLDCYFKPGEPGDQIAFEEHASYCDICVKTTLMAKAMVAEGKTLREIRAAVDQSFGGSVPGTPTELPPA